MKTEALLSEVEVLIQQYVEGSLAPDEAQTLYEAVRRDPSLARHLVEHLESDAAIRELVLQPDWIAENPSVSPPIDARRFFGSPSRVLALALAACIAFLALCTSFFFGPDLHPALAGNFTEAVLVERDGVQLIARAGFRLRANDQITTGADPVTLNYSPERTRIELSPGTTVRLHSSSRGKRLELTQGELFAQVSSQPIVRPMILRTPHAEARVLGTEFLLQTTAVQTRLDVLEGQVRFTRSSDNQKTDVAAGYHSQTSEAGALASKPIPGKILRELWLDLSGDTLQSLIFNRRFPNAPDRTDYPASFESHTNWTSAFGTRSRAYLTAPQDGDYSFSVSGNGQIRLFLSPDEDPANKAVVAQIIFSRNQVEGDTSRVASSNKSEPITLVKGERYYVEVLHKSGRGNDDLGISWQRPDGRTEPVPSDALTLFPKTGGK